MILNLLNNVNFNFIYSESRFSKYCLKIFFQKKKFSYCRLDNHLEADKILENFKKLKQEYEIMSNKLKNFEQEKKRDDWQNAKEKYLLSKEI